MANSNATSLLVAKTMTEFFEQKSPILNTANRDYVETFSQQNYATGGTINIKIPGYPLVQRGLTITPSDIQDLIVPYTITPNDIYSVGRQLNLYESKFNILGGDRAALTGASKKAIVDNYAWPAYEALEGAIENTAALRLKTTAYLSPVDGVDVLGSLNTYAQMASIEAMAEELKFSRDRYMMMNIQDATAVTTSLQNMFNEMINKNITLNARVGGPDKGRLAGLDVYRCTQLQRHIAGPLAGVAGITVASLAADGVTLTLAGVPVTAGPLVNAGDRISIPSIFLLSNITFDVLRYRLVATAAANANGNNDGTVTVTLSYPLMASGEHANVSALPAPGATVQFFPSHNINFAYVPSGLSAVPLALGEVYGAVNATNRGENKVPVSVYLQGQVLNLNNVYRTSCLVGIKAFAPYIIAFPSLP